MTLYRDIIKRAVKSSWSNKYFWFFGLFATFFASSSVYGLFVNAVSGDIANNPFPILNRLGQMFSLETLGNMGQLMATRPLDMAIVVFLYLAFTILFAFLVWLSTVSQAALVNNAALDLNEKENNLKIGLNAWTSHFWPVFYLNVFLKVIFYLGFFLISLPFVLGLFQDQSLGDNLIFSIIFIIFASLAIIFSFIIKYSIAYIVLKKKGLIASLRDGWKLFKDNWIISIEMAFLLFFIDFFINLILLLFLLIITVPFVFMAFLLASWNMLSGFWTLLLLAFLIFFLVAVFSRSIITSFQIVSWTDLFVVLSGRGGKSKLERFTESLTGKKS